MKKILSKVLWYLMVVLGVVLVALEVYIPRSSVSIQGMNYKVLEYDKGFITYHTIYAKEYRVGDDTITLENYQGGDRGTFYRATSTGIIALDKRKVISVMDLKSKEVVYLTDNTTIKEYSDSVVYQYHWWAIGVILVLIIVVIIRYLINISTKKKVRLERKYETSGMIWDFLDDRCIKHSVQGIISTRTWILKRDGLYSVNQGTQWRNRIEYSDNLPESKNNYGIYAHRLGCGNKIWDGAYSSIFSSLFKRNVCIGIVAQGGQYILHRDGIVRSERCEVLVVVVRNRKMAHEIISKYGVPVVIRKDLNYAIYKWMIGNSGIYWMQHNNDLLGQSQDMKYQLGEVKA